jgi:superfamily II DNA or RNA helicase
MKAIISNRIYLRPKNEEHELKIQQELTKRIEKRVSRASVGRFAAVETIKNYTNIRGVYSIPNGRLDLIPEDYEIEDRRIYDDIPFPEPLIPLRLAQEPVFEAVDDSCIINAKVGWGKSITALHIARKLHQKTLIVAHNTMLRDQWVENVENVFGITPGVIGGGTVGNLEDHPIVVGNIQTLTKFALPLSKVFGTLVVDEMHHIVATTFTKFVDASYARYRIGLSGTLERTDQKHVLFPDYFGPVVHRPPESDTLTPRVVMLPSGLFVPPDLDYAKKLNFIFYNDEFAAFVAGLARSQIAEGYSILIPAERTEFLHKIKELIGASCAVVTGETSYEERQEILRKIETKEIMCIAGSRSIWTEGISANRLSMLILCSPTANPSVIDQITGRIRRKADGKPDPVVLDIYHASPAEKATARKRLALYGQWGWKVLKS